jgi:hypothetical protein
MTNIAESGKAAKNQKYAFSDPDATFPLNVLFTFVLQNVQNQFGAKHPNKNLSFFSISTSNSLSFFKKGINTGNRKYITNITPTVIRTNAKAILLFQFLEE